MNDDTVTQEVVTEAEVEVKQDNKVIDLAAILEKHRKWLAGKAGGEPASLSKVDLRRANLQWANLQGANLQGAKLQEAKLQWAKLQEANLQGAKLQEAKLQEANLQGAKLQEAKLQEANLQGANLQGANLQEANLQEANLQWANLSQSKGLLDPIEYLLQNFERDPENRGLIAYKAFGAYNASPAAWKIEPGSILTEVVLFDRTVECACGINVATLKWIKNDERASNRPIWRVLIRWEWLAGVCVPYHTDGKVRCSKVELLETLRSP